MNVVTSSLWAAGGALAGWLSLWSVRRAVQGDASRTRTAWAVLLVVAAAIYAAFAALGVASVTWGLVELAGLCVYGCLAWFGARRRAAVIGMGWLLHVLWDVGLHAGGHPGYVPAWYPPACLGFDVVVGATLLRQWRWP